MRSSSPSLLPSESSTNIEEDNQEFIYPTEQQQQQPQSSMIDDDDLNRKVEQCFRNNSEQQLEDHFMQIDQPLQSKEKYFYFN
jgi:hypothetical protein